MKLITRDTDYAVRALCFMARRNDLVSVSELVKELNIPRAFLRKILQSLNKKGILKSYKGKNGGFALAQEAKNIFVVDLIKIFQGPVKISDCLFRKRVCPDVRVCMLKQKISGIERQVISELGVISIASLIAS